MVKRVTWEKPGANAKLAREMYERAVAADPTHTNNLSNFALLLADASADPRQAGTDARAGKAARRADAARPRRSRARTRRLAPTASPAVFWSARAPAAPPAPTRSSRKTTAAASSAATAAPRPHPSHRYRSS